jgi:hypothetical protein
MKKFIYLLLIISQATLSQNITPWTEQNGPLGLGYPIPIPVDTPEPFDGFRTYNGLFSKHQIIESENPLVSGHIVGQTIHERDIWAYILSDEDQLTKYGVKEGAMMINGGIHAREWQSPEVVTGVIELLNDNSNDHFLHQYLLENTAIIAIPVNNIDGFLQTQRYPAENWLGTDPDDTGNGPNPSPRDGRMRRKNMLNADEDLLTMDDHLYGVDLNRNNDPYWATNPNRSSPDPLSIVHHGASINSEPETLARLAAAELVDAEQLRAYTDVHSFSQVHASIFTSNTNRNLLQIRLLDDFTRHHVSYPARKNYFDVQNTANTGIGLTAEYFAHEYQIPSWTLEVEPSRGHPDLPGAGADYGGFANNGHDGFILPESEIRRVREQVAASFMIAWYEQAGPPSITQLRIFEKETDILVYDAEWDIQDNGGRELFENEIDNLIPGNDYTLVIHFDKPMRVRDENNLVQHLQGQFSALGNAFPLSPNIKGSVDNSFIFLNLANGGWVNEKTSSAKSYKHYIDDTYAVDITIPQELSVSSNLRINWSISVNDMVQQALDANPASVITWANGQWINYEDSQGNSSINGGTDTTLSSPVGTSTKNEFPARIQNTGLYYDPSRSGEGFSYELLSTDGQVWLQWFTYDEQGNQRWYIDLDSFNGNIMTINDILQAQGGIFGEAFNAENIAFSPFGSLEIVFSGGEQRLPAIGSHNIIRTAAMKYTDSNGKKLRTTLHQLSFLKDNPSDLSIFEGPLPPAIFFGDSSFTGSWYDPNRSGEGYIIEMLEDGRAILLWYTYDLEGNHMWLIDSNGEVTQTDSGIILDFNAVLQTNGPVFGENYNTNDLNTTPWGEIQFDLSCFNGTVSYLSVLDGYGQGTYDITKLTNPVNLITCANN